MTHDYAARRTRVQEELAGWGVDALLVTTPSDLRYLTGFGGTTSLGPNPFTGGPSAVLLVSRDGALLCLPESDVAALPAEDGTLDRATYPTFLELSPLYPRRLFVDTVVRMLAEAGVQGGRVGYQAATLPVVLADAIGAHFDRLDRRELGDRIGLMRMRKSESEIAAIRCSAAVCDAAQATVREHARAGVTEAEILAAIERTVEGLAGPCALIHEVTSGPRSGRIGFSASERELQEGDLLLTDIAPQVDGYWGDSCATQPIGEPDRQRASMLRVVHEALVKGTEAVRPGALTRDVDRVMREHVGSSFPAYHNSGGHGVGLDYHEPPRLVPTEELPLEAGMVIALEPGIYLPDVAGVRLEHLVLVTPDSCEVLSRHLSVGR